MATINIPQNEFDDLDVSDPYAAITAQLNSTESIASFSACAESLGYSTKSTTHWTDRLSNELDAVTVDETDNVFAQEEHR